MKKTVKKLMSIALCTGLMIGVSATNALAWDNWYAVSVDTPVCDKDSGWCYIWDSSNSEFQTTHYKRHLRNSAGEIIDTEEGYITRKIGCC